MSEGIAIAAPLAKGRPSIGRLVSLVLIAGMPTIFGAWIGGFLYSPFSAVVFLSIGVGAVFQVMITILKWIREDGDKKFNSVHTRCILHCIAVHYKDRFATLNASYSHI